MGLFGWIFYILMGFVFFIIIRFIDSKYNINKLEKIIISVILLIITAGFCFKYVINCVDNMFLIFVFLLIFDVLYDSYFTDKDFFDKTDGNIKYYIILILIGFFVNQEFINKVTQVFLTGEDLRIILWYGSFVFIYNFCKNKNIFTDSVKKNNNSIVMSDENILVNYTKLKYRYDGSFKCDNKEIINIIYAIMIFENNRRSKLLRDYDYFMFRLNGHKRKLGIMQVESSKFITDSDSIEIVVKKIDKFINKSDKIKTKSKIKINYYDLIKNYDKENYDYIKHIFDVIEKF